MVTNNAINSNTNQFLKIASNLSDVGSVSTSRTNLGLGTADTPTFRGVQLSNASSNYVQFNVPPSGLTNQTYVLPSAFPVSSGQALVSTTTGTTSWASSLTGTVDLIATVNASASSSVSFTSLSSVYFCFWLSSGNIQLSASSNSLLLRLSTNNGSTYDSGNNYFFSRFAWDNSPASSSGGGNNQSSFLLNSGYTMSGVATALQNFSVYMWGLGITSARPYILTTGNMDNGTRPSENLTGGFYDTGSLSGLNTSAIQITPASGTITGTFKLYGFKA